MTRKTIVEIIAGLLVLLFIYASFSKIFDFNMFKHDMHIQPFPTWLSKSLVWIVPGIEILISIALMLDRTRQIGLYSSMILMFAFTIYTSAVLLHLFGKIPCSCGGVIKKLTWEQHLYFNIFFLTISVIAILLLRKKVDQNQFQFQVATI